MTLAAINAVYEQSGIDPNTLSPEVKEGLNAILANAGLTALQQFQKILEAELRKRGLGLKAPNTGTSVDQSEAAKKAIEEFTKQQEAEAAAAKRKKVYTYVGAGLGGLLLIVGLVIIIRKSRK